MIVWIAHAKVGHRQAPFKQNSPAQTAGLFCCCSVMRSARRTEASAAQCCQDSKLPSVVRACKRNESPAAGRVEVSVYHPHAPRTGDHTVNSRLWMSGWGHDQEIGADAAQVCVIGVHQRRVDAMGHDMNAVDREPESGVRQRGPLRRRDDIDRLIDLPGRSKMVDVLLEQDRCSGVPNTNLRPCAGALKSGRSARIVSVASGWKDSSGGAIAASRSSFSCEKIPRVRRHVSL